MNIWIMNHYAAPMFKDKAGRHYWFARELKKKGHDVTVFCSATITSNIFDTNNELWGQDQDDDTKFVYLKNTLCKGNGIDRIMNMVNFYRYLFPTCKQYLKKTGRPDIILASSVHPLTMVAGIKIAKKLKIPCICEIRDLWPEAIFAFGNTKEKSLLGKILITGEHWIYRNARALIFTKEGDTDYLKEKGWTTEQGGDIDLSKCHYINNGVDLETYTRQIDVEQLIDPDLSEECFNIVYTGTLRPVNNVGNLLDCAKILKDYSDIRFLIYGDGSQYKELKDRISAEHIENVYLKGAVQRKYIPYVLSKSSVNILNYSQNQYNWTRGNSSNKLFEYMASGKPVISTVKMGYSIIQRYDCGIELDECTPKALSDAILKIYHMPKAERDKLGINARNGAEDFNITKFTDKLVRVIESVL